MDWWYIAMLVSLCIFLLGLGCFAIFIIKIRLQEKKKEELKNETKQKDFMDEETNKLKSDEISKE